MPGKRNETAKIMTLQVLTFSTHHYLATCFDVIQLVQRDDFVQDKIQLKISYAREYEGLKIRKQRF